MPIDISAGISVQHIYFFSFGESACKTERSPERLNCVRLEIHLNHRIQELAGQPRRLLFHLILAVRCSFTEETWPQSKIQPEAQSSHKRELPLKTCKCERAMRRAGREMRNDLWEEGQ